MLTLQKTEIDDDVEIVDVDVNEYAIAYCKFYDTKNDKTWYATDFDGDDTYFGLIFIGNKSNWGNFSAKDMENNNEEEWDFPPTLISDIRKSHILIEAIGEINGINTCSFIISPESVVDHYLGRTIDERAESTESL